MGLGPFTCLVLAFNRGKLLGVYFLQKTNFRNKMKYFNPDYILNILYDGISIFFIIVVIFIDRSINQSIDRSSVY